MVKVNLPKTYHFLGENIPPGTRKVVELEVAKLYTSTPLSIPIEVIHGAKKGPVLMINAAIHGDELNGVEIVRQMINTIDPAKLKGTLICVPIVNALGFTQKIRYLPDRRDLNRCFPGTNKGSLASRLAATFFNEVVLKCNYIIDLHTGSIHRTNLPQIRANLSKPEILAMAQAFATPVIIDSSLRNGSLRGEAEKYDIPVITYEGGEALKFDPIAIHAGIVGIKRVMHNLNMLSRSRKKIPTSFIAKSTSWLRASHDGILRTVVSLGDKVIEGQTLAYINAPLGHFEVEIQAIKGGIVIGQQTLPLVNEGDAIFNIAHLDKNQDDIEQVVEEFIDDVSENELDPITTGYITPM